MNLKTLLTNLNPFKKATQPPIKEEEQESVAEVEIVESKPKRKAFGIGVEVKNYKFSEPEKQMMVAWWATGLTPSEVVERAREELHVEVTPMQILNYSRAEKWQPIIRKIRNETMSDIAAVAGSHKRVRLERHEKIFEKALKKNDLKNAVNATEHQRKEMEGAGDMVNLTLNQFNVLSDDELEFKKKEVMDRIKLMTDHKEKKV